MTAAETLARPTWVRLKAEALARGFVTRDGRPNVLQFRRWCARVGVPVRKTGRIEWVHTAAVDRAVAGEPAPTTAPGNDDGRVNHLVATLMGRN